MCLSLNSCLVSELIISESTTRRSDWIIFLAEVATQMSSYFLHWLSIRLGLLKILFFLFIDDQNVAVFFGIWYLVQSKVPNRPFDDLELNLPQKGLLLCMRLFSLHTNLLMSRKSTACKEYIIQLPREWSLH